MVLFWFGFFTISCLEFFGGFVLFSKKTLKAILSYLLNLSFL